MKRFGLRTIALGVAMYSCLGVHALTAQDRGKADAGSPAAPMDSAAPALNRHDAEAHALFSAGASALAEGRFEEALDCFERSYRLSGRPEILYNIGLAQDRLRHDREALSAFEAYLRLSPDKERRADARARLKVLKRALGKGAVVPREVGALGPTGLPPTAVRSEPATATATASVERDAGAAPPRPGQRTVVAAPPPSSPIEESPLLRGL